MMNKNLQIGATILTTALITPQSAMADSFHRLGYNLSSDMVNSAWADFNSDCEKADTLMQIVDDATTNAEEDIGSMPTKGVENFGAGFLDGLADALTNIVNECKQECSSAGRVEGKAGARIFCAVSARLGRPATYRGRGRVKNMICGQPFTMSCSTTFLNMASDRCPAYSDGFSAYRSGNGGCCSYRPN